MYDALGQLTRVNDEYASETWTYEYDQGGNILKKTCQGYTTQPLQGVLGVYTYTYGNPSWKDQLTAYNGKNITYDTIGNPLTYDGWAYTWKAGRMLERMLKLDMEAMTRKEVTFTYDHTGLRVKKSFNGTDTLYTLNGKKITHVRKQVNGENIVRMHFFYDAQGRPSIIRYNDVDYVYVHNLQGDVIAIVDMDGNKVVEYGYDAWGKPTGKSGTLAGTLGTDNPFRYRGYMYDEETGLYYLRSRYYDPCWGRFLNADVVLGKTGALLSPNLFISCLNDPVNSSDSSGLDPVPFRMPAELYEKYGGYHHLIARIYLPGEIVIEGEIRQTRSFYHYDFFFGCEEHKVAGGKEEFLQAIDNLGSPYKSGEYNPGVPVRFEVDYPDGTMKTWALMHPDPHPEVCVWLLGSNGAQDRSSTGRDDLEIGLVPLAFFRPSFRAFVANMGKDWRARYYPDKGMMTKKSKKRKQREWTMEAE